MRIELLNGNGLSLFVHDALPHQAEFLWRHAWKIFQRDVVPAELRPRRRSTSQWDDVLVSIDNVTGEVGLIPANRDGLEYVDISSVRTHWPEWVRVGESRPDAQSVEHALVALISRIVGENQVDEALRGKTMSFWGETGLIARYRFDTEGSLALDHQVHGVKNS